MNEGQLADEWASTHKKLIDCSCGCLVGYVGSVSGAVNCDR